MEVTQRNQHQPPAKGGLHPKDMRLCLWWIVPGPSLGRSQGPQRMDGAGEEGGIRHQVWCRRTARLMWVGPNGKSLVKLYFYRDLLYDIKGTGAWHDFSSRKGLYRNTKKMYRKFYRFILNKDYFDQRAINQTTIISYMYKPSNVYRSFDVKQSFQNLAWVKRIR